LNLKSFKNPKTHGLNMPEERTLPAWVFSEKRPTKDKEYFENLTRCVFQGGLNWTMIANKWPNFKAAFDDFDIEKVANYGLEDQERLRNDAGIIRNRQKIMATIHNAEEFKRIVEEHGSFQKWLDGLDKGNNYDYVVKRLGSRFKRVGPGTAHIFLWSVGEPIKWDESVHSRRPSKLA
jgi:DNA-3-methyladenine glycosylase I